MVGKGPAGELCRDVPIKSCDLTEPATEYDRIGIDCVDDRGQCAGESILVTRECRFSQGLAGLGLYDDLASGQLLAGNPRVIGGKRRSSQPLFDASRFAAEAGW